MAGLSGLQSRDAFTDIYTMNGITYGADKNGKLYVIDKQGDKFKVLCETKDRHIGARDTANGNAIKFDNESLYELSKECVLNLDKGKYWPIKDDSDAFLQTVQDTIYLTHLQNRDKDYISALDDKDFKQGIMDMLKKHGIEISEAEYDEFTAAAKGIAKRESDLGTGWRSSLIEVLKNTDNGRVIVNWVKLPIREYQGFKPSPELSYGMTCIKLEGGYLSPEEKKLLQDIGIRTNKDNNLGNPIHSAAATMALLVARHKRSYNTYMKNFNKAREENKEKNGELTDKEEKEFIEMLSGKDESKWNNILKINNFFRGKEKPKTEEDKKLVETAKRFIDKYGEPLNTIEYSAAIWNGLKVLPDKSDNMSFYGRMLQQFLNRQRRSTESGEKVDIPVKPGKKSDPPDDYIGYVAYFAQKYNQGLDRS